MDESLRWNEDGRSVATLGVDARAAFLARTYGTLFGAIVAFVLVEIALFQTRLPESMVRFLSGGSWRWLLFLGAFVLLGSLASRLAIRARTQGAQLAALGAYVVIEALIFLPLLLVAQAYADGGVIESAALVTLAGFTGLTAIVLVTRRDFSFLRGLVVYGGLLALVVIVVAALGGLSLGAWFSIAMVGLAGATILFQTSSVLHSYPEDRHVAAALALFAAVALLFWYVLQLFLASRD